MDNKKKLSKNDDKPIHSEGMECEQGIASHEELKEVVKTPTKSEMIQNKENVDFINKCSASGTNNGAKSVKKNSVTVNENSSSKSEELLDSNNNGSELELQGCHQLSEKTNKCEPRYRERKDTSEFFASGEESDESLYEAFNPSAKALSKEISNDDQINYREHSSSSDSLDNFNDYPNFASYANAFLGAMSNLSIDQSIEALDIPSGNSSRGSMSERRAYRKLVFIDSDSSCDDKQLVGSIPPKSSPSASCGIPPENIDPRLDLPGPSNCDIPDYVHETCELNSNLSTQSPKGSRGSSNSNICVVDASSSTELPGSANRDVRHENEPVLNVSAISNRSFLNENLSLGSSNRNAERLDVSSSLEMPGCSKDYARRTHESPSMSKLNDSDSSSDGDQLSKSLKRKRHRRKKSKPLRSSDSNIRKNSSEHKKEFEESSLSDTPRSLKRYRGVDNLDYTKDDTLETVQKWNSDKNLIPETFETNRSSRKRHGSGHGSLETENSSAGAIIHKKRRRSKSSEK